MRLSKNFQSSANLASVRRQQRSRWCFQSAFGFAIFILSAVCNSRHLPCTAAAFQGSSGIVTVVPQQYQQRCFLPHVPSIFGSTRHAVSHSPRTVRPLFDTERTEAEMTLSAPLVPESDEPTTGHTNGTLQVTVTQDSPEAEMEVPVATANGGYSHTSASKAKISAANKGRTPWNKGKARSEEVRERIAAGVRAKNRERFLEKLETLGMTEEEYEQQKKFERNKKATERRARMTDKGGYRPTEETKQKISEILKSKWANGEISRRDKDPSKVRSGFSHTPETRAKISEALRKKWASDEEYRESMKNKTSVVNTNVAMRDKISQTLKAKWQDPEFRDKMMEKIRSRRAANMERDDDYRRKISEAMKAKWQDNDYRNKTMASIRQRASVIVKDRPPREPRPKKAAKSTTGSKVRLAQVAATRHPREARKQRPSEIDQNDKPAVKVKKAKKVKKADVDGIKIVVPRASDDDSRIGDVSLLTKKVENPKKAKEPDGSITRLRDERRDLYDLLYGDDEDIELSNDFPISGGIMTMLDLANTNLDTFDPYGLDDF